MAFNRRVTGPMPDPQIMLVPMPSRRYFIVRTLRNAAIAGGVVGGGLLIGMIGYHRLGGLGWIESFYYSSMILSGEGPPPDPRRRCIAFCTAFIWRLPRTMSRMRATRVRPLAAEDPARAF